MIVLALETATEACSAALNIDGEIQERFDIAPRGHSQLILPMVEELLAEAGIGLGQVDALAFGRGPGAFTGVRIAVGVAQGIAFGADLPVVPVSTLAALAQGCAADKVLVAMDARMHEVYWGAYQRESSGMMSACQAECVTVPDAVPLPSSTAWIGAGSGWQAYPGLRQRCETLVADILPEALPHAREVASLGAAGYAAGEAVAAEEALPVYLRDEVAWKKVR